MSSSIQAHVPGQFRNGDFERSDMVIADLIFTVSNNVNTQGNWYGYTDRGNTIHGSTTPSPLFINGHEILHIGFGAGYFIIGLAGDTSAENGGAPPLSQIAIPAMPQVEMQGLFYPGNVPGGVLVHTPGTIGSGSALTTHYHWPDPGGATAAFAALPAPTQIIITP